jgi:hypothetical protein
MPHLVPIWRSFAALPSNNEALTASVCCSYSFETLQIACSSPGLANFALTEQRQINMWRWAICSTRGLILLAGCESTQTGAKTAAEEALQMEEAAF